MARNSGPRACSGPGGAFIVQDPYVLSSEHTPLTSADVREGWQASMRSQPSARYDVDQYYLRARARGAGSRSFGQVGFGPSGQFAQSGQ